MPQLHTSTPNGSYAQSRDLHGSLDTTGRGGSGRSTKWTRSVPSVFGRRAHLRARRTVGANREDRDPPRTLARSGVQPTRGNSLPFSLRRVSLPQNQFAISRVVARREIRCVWDLPGEQLRPIRAPACPPFLLTAAFGPTDTPARRGGAARAALLRAVWSRGPEPAGVAARPAVCGVQRRIPIAHSLANSYHVPSGQK